MNTTSPHTAPTTWLQKAGHTLQSQLRVVTTAMALSLGLAAVSQAADIATAMVKVDDASFKCMRQMTPVRHFYVDNLLGDITATLAAAKP